MFLSTLLTAYFWLFLAAIAGGLAFLICYTVIHSTGRSRNFSNLRDWLPGLLRQGYDGSHLSLTDRKTGRTLRFHKYIRGKDLYGLEFRILESEWVESARRKLDSFAQVRGIGRRTEIPTEEQPSGHTLTLDFGQDIDAAYDFAVAVWTEIFGLTLKTPYKPDQDEWALPGEKIDGPDHDVPLNTLSPSERQKELSARLQKTGVSNQMALFIGLLVLLLLVSGVGCPIAFLLSRYQAPDWSFNLGPLSLGGSTSSLVWFTIFCVSFWIVQSLSKRLRQKMGPRINALTTWERKAGRVARAFAATLPVAAFLAWAGY